MKTIKIENHLLRKIKNSGKKRDVQSLHDFDGYLVTNDIVMIKSDDQSYSYQKVLDCNYCPNCRKRFSKGVAGGFEPETVIYSLLDFFNDDPIFDDGSFRCNHYSILVIKNNQESYRYVWKDEKHRSKIEYITMELCFALNRAFSNDIVEMYS